MMLSSIQVLVGSKMKVILLKVIISYFFKTEITVGTRIEGVECLQDLDSSKLCLGSLEQRIWEGTLVTEYRLLVKY